MTLAAMSSQQQVKAKGFTFSFITQLRPPIPEVNFPSSGLCLHSGEQMGVGTPTYPAGRAAFLFDRGRNHNLYHFLA